MLNNNTDCHDWKHVSVFGITGSGKSVLAIPDSINRVKKIRGFPLLKRLSRYISRRRNAH